MLLDEWLYQQGITTRQFAKKMDVSYQAVWAWRNRKTFPSGRHMAAIETLTKAQVTAGSWGTSNA